MNKYIKITAVSALIMFVALSGFHYLYGTTVQPKTTADFSKTSVMITRNDGRSGGSGVVYSSTRNESKILTNRHVCEVAKYGGIVRSDTKRAQVKYYQESETHDLCLITVNANFKVNTVLARTEPEVYDDSIVSGHPILLENIVTYGHFSGHEKITVLIGMRPCTPQEISDPTTAFFCGLLGGIPLVKTYEAQVTSNLIQPGSSGSAVFNKEGELAGLVFAGSGDLGFAHIVPYTYLVTFFENELVLLPKIYPSEAPPANMSAASRGEWKTICSRHSTRMKSLCESVNNSFLMTY